jgi:hypothetical protein
MCPLQRLRLALRNEWVYFIEVEKDLSWFAACSVVKEESRMNLDPVIGHWKFADGAMRPIYDDGQRQYVIDDDGFTVYAVWLIPEKEPTPPLVVPADEIRS